MHLLRSLITLAIFATAGWYGGAKFGAPDFLLSGADNAIEQAKQIAGGLLNYDDGANADEDGASAPDEPDTSEATQSVSTPAPARPALTSRASTSDDLYVCRTTVNNAAPADATGRVVTFTPFVQLNGVTLLLNPTTKSCLSSGFGYRGMSPHRGLDYYSDTGGVVFAAGDGVIREVVTREDYGNMVLIDHGAGVYSRYAHLANFENGVTVGATVQQGETLGPIGQTGRAGAPHLHYEIRTGDYSTNAGSFALEPVDPFSLSPG